MQRKKGVLSRRIHLVEELCGAPGTMTAIVCSFDHKVTRQLMTDDASQAGELSESSGKSAECFINCGLGDYLLGDRLPQQSSQNSFARMSQ